MFLEEILRTCRERVEEERRRVPMAELIAVVRESPRPRDFYEALAPARGDEHPGPRVIAELKRASPSRGVFRRSMEVTRLAPALERAGAVALSVVTEEAYFHGRLELLAAAKGCTLLPLLRKDFIIHEYQVYQSRAAGADALLLIARLLEGEQLREYVALAQELEMSVLVEVHSEAELEKALGSGARIIGVNNRDLDTFTTDLQTTTRLLPLIPPDRVVVAESGISRREDITVLLDAGVRVFLIGECLMRARDVGAKLRALLGADSGGGSC